MNAPERHGELRLYGEHGALPLRSPCPAGCRFCYETHLPRLLPNVTLVRRPAYSPEAFERFCDGLAGTDLPATPVSPVFVEAGRLHYSSMSDIFCQGLSREQLERLVRHNLGRERRELATTGNHLDPQTAAELTRRYPDTFRLHYSVVTLAAELRSKLFARAASPDTVLATLAVLREPKLYLCHLDPAQTIADLRAINACVQPGARVQVARLHCTRLHSAELRTLARRSGQGLAELVDWLAGHRAELDRIAEIGFQAPPEGYAWVFRDALREALRPLGLGRGDVVVCSPAAGDVLRRQVLPSAATLLPVFDSLGATTSFTTTLANANVLSALRALRFAPRRVVLPSSIYWVEDRYSIDGGSPDDLRAQLPGVEVVLVDVPHEMRRARLSLEQCRDYFDRNPAARLQADYRGY